MSVIHCLTRACRHTSAIFIALDSGSGSRLCHFTLFLSVPGLSTTWREQGSVELMQICERAFAGRVLGFGVIGSQPDNGYQTLPRITGFVRTAWTSGTRVDSGGRDSSSDNKWEFTRLSLLPVPRTSMCIRRLLGGGILNLQVKQDEVEKRRKQRHPASALIQATPGLMLATANARLRPSTTKLGSRLSHKIGEN